MGGEQLREIPSLNLPSHLHKHLPTYMMTHINTHTHTPHKHTEKCIQFKVSVLGRKLWEHKCKENALREEV